MNKELMQFFRLGVRIHGADGLPNYVGEVPYTTALPLTTDDPLLHVLWSGRKKIEVVETRSEDLLLLSRHEFNGLFDDIIWLIENIQAGTSTTKHITPEDLERCRKVGRELMAWGERNYENF